MVRVEAGSADRDMFIPWGSKDFTVDAMSGRSWEGVGCSLGDRTSEVNKNWEGRRRGLTMRFRQAQSGAVEWRVGV